MPSDSADGHEFKPMLAEIDEAPASPLGRTVLWLIIGVLVVAGLWAVVGKVDVVVTARGKVVPLGEIKTVQPLTTGVVRAIRVAPGDRVAAGQALMEIEPFDTAPELASLQTERQLVQLETQRLEALADDRPFEPSPSDFDPVLIGVQTRLFAATRQRLADQLAAKQAELAETGQRLAAESRNRDQALLLVEISGLRLERLEQVNDVVSRDELDKARSEAADAQSRADIAAHAIAALKATAKRIANEMAAIKEEERSRWLTELAQKRQQAIALQADIDKTGFVNQRQAIVSPVNGDVARLLVHTVGGVVTPAQELAHIVPADAALVIKALVLNKDVGFVGAGMDATIKVDSFDFQKYGTLAGRVIQVAKDSVEDKTLGLVYEATIKPLQTRLAVEGKEAMIAAGMSATVEIMTGQRRVIEFFIYPLIKYLDEGISVR